MFSAIFLAKNTLTVYVIYRTGIFLSREDSNTQEMSPETFQFFSRCPFSRHHAQIQILLASPLSSSSTATNTTLCELCKSHARTTCLTAPHSYQVAEFPLLPAYLLSGEFRLLQFGNSEELCPGGEPFKSGR